MSYLCSNLSPRKSIDGVFSFHPRTGETRPWLSLVQVQGSFQKSILVTHPSTYLFIINILLPKCWTCPPVLVHCVVRMQRTAFLVVTAWLEKFSKSPLSSAVTYWCSCCWWWSKVGNSPTHPFTEPSRKSPLENVWCCCCAAAASHSPQGGLLVLIFPAIQVNLSMGGSFALLCLASPPTDLLCSRINRSALVPSLEPAFLSQVTYLYWSYLEPVPREQLRLLKYRLFSLSFAPSYHCQGGNMWLS